LAHADVVRVGRGVYVFDISPSRGIWAEPPQQHVHPSYQSAWWEGYGSVCLVVPSCKLGGSVGVL
jgi:hypothetical protein